ATNYYDNGVVQFDRVVSQLLEHLQHKGYLDNALVVITGDHGELLGEHGQFSHAKTVYDAVLRVPFVLIRYGYEADQQLRSDMVSSQVDIAPTILSELRMPLPSTWVGTPIQSQ